MRADVSHAIAASLASDINDVTPVSGGDINEAYRVGLADGRTIFVKTRPGAPAGMYRAEAEGLAWLAEANALPLPSVLAHADECDASPGFLALEYVEGCSPAPDHDELLGTGLAALHRCAPAAFGFPSGNFIGPLPQDNRACDSWWEFYAERRLLPQLELARTRKRAPAAMVHGMDKLIARLPDLAGDPEPPARLHGDLWGGNAMRDSSGRPCLIDPAVYGGHREIDLAMMRLFGGFSGRVFAAYEAAYPLSPGAQERVPLYQLYPLLVHVNLFGSGYVGQVQQVLDRYV